MSSSSALAGGGLSSALAGGRGWANTLVPSAHRSGDSSSAQPRSAAAFPIQTSPGSRRFRQAPLQCKVVSLGGGGPGFLRHHCHACTRIGCRLGPWRERSECQRSVSHRARSVFARLGWGSSEMPVHFQRNINHNVYSSFSCADPCLTARMGFTVN